MKPNDWSDFEGFTLTSINALKKDDMHAFLNDNVMPLTLDYLYTPEDYARIRYDYVEATKDETN